MHDLTHSPPPPPPHPPRTCWNTSRICAAHDIGFTLPVEICRTSINHERSEYSSCLNEPPLPPASLLHTTRDGGEWIHCAARRPGRDRNLPAQSLSDLASGRLVHPSVRPCRPNTSMLLRRGENIILYIEASYFSPWMLCSSWPSTPPHPTPLPTSLFCILWRQQLTQTASSVLPAPPDFLAACCETLIIGRPQEHQTAAKSTSGLDGIRVECLQTFPAFESSRLAFSFRSNWFQWLIKSFWLLSLRNRL